jgi:S1-C subfamily serine protease
MSLDVAFYSADTASIARYRGRTSARDLARVDGRRPRRVTAMSSSERRPFVTCSPFALILVIVFLLAWFGWKQARRIFGDLNAPDATPRAITARGDLAMDEKSTIELFRQASPSVVFITTSVRGYNRFTLSPFEVPLGSGSGFVWDDRGYIVTNYHVVKDSSRALVTLADQTQYEAETIYVAPDYDIAVIKVDAPKASMPALAVGTSKDLAVGQKVFAIGNPFGLDHTLTTGIISAIDREITSVTGARIRGVIQTDAAINPGNSGGPLLDSAGRLIGMNTAIANPLASSGVEGFNVGIGFAIPVDMINQVVPVLMRNGKFTPPRMGVSLFPDSIASRWGVDGVVVEQVEPGGPAEKAGLRSATTTRGKLNADAIVAIDGRAIGSLADLRDVLREHAAGDTVRVDAVRDGQKLALQVTLQ